MTQPGNGTGACRFARRMWLQRLLPRGPYPTAGRPPRDGPPRCRRRRNAPCEGTEPFAPDRILASARWLGFLSASSQETRHCAMPDLRSPALLAGPFCPAPMAATSCRSQYRSVVLLAAFKPALNSIYTSLQRPCQRTANSQSLLSTAPTVPTTTRMFARPRDRCSRHSRALWSKMCVPGALHEVDIDDQEFESRRGRVGKKAGSRERNLPGRLCSRGTPIDASMPPHAGVPTQPHLPWRAALRQDPEGCVRS